MPLVCPIPMQLIRCMLFLATSLTVLNSRADQPESCDWAQHDAALSATTDADQSTRAELLKLYRELTSRRRNDHIAVENDRPAGTPEEKAQWLDASRKLMAADKAGQDLVFALLARCGWPERGALSGRAADAIWLVIQHANLESQLRFRQMAEQAVRDQKLRPQQYALLIDRIRTRQGQPQLYGSQLETVATTDGARTVMLPIEDEVNLDQRRAALGLGPICEYIAGFRDLDAGKVYEPCKRPLHR